MRLGVSVGLMVWLGLASLSPGIAQQAGTAKAKVLGNPAPAGAPVKEIELKARKYEFSPPLIEVPTNTLLRIHLTAVDREHGFEIKSLPGSCVKFKPGEPFTVEYFADKPGEIEFACCKFCGFGHGKMKGKLVVK
jgi:cytochrome c oxidase subunit II